MSKVNKKGHIMPSSYDNYTFKRDVANIKHDAYYIQKIPADELTYEKCCVAMKKAAGDYEFFKWFLQKYPKFVDENLCKIAVSAEPKKKWVRSSLAMEDPDGTTYYDEEYKYFDPVIKYIPEKFRTVAVCIESAKHDWRTLQFVPKAIQLANQEVCETAVNNCDKIMNDDIERRNREKVIFDALDKSVFEQYPNIFDGELTLKNVSAKWIATNADKVGTILLKHPEHIKLLPKDFRKNHFEIIRDIASKNPEIWEYLSATDQKKLRDITRDMAQKHPKILKYLCAAEQKEFVDLIKTALSSGKISLGDVKASTQVLIPETCVKKLTNDPYEKHWLYKIWAHKPTPGLNLMDLCKDLQNQNAELISKLVCEHIELLKYVDTDVLVAHPEICVAVVEKFGAAKAYDIIPQAVFDKKADLYEQLLQKCPELLPKYPAKFQTRKNWTKVLTNAPWLASSAPKQYVTIEHYKNAFLDDRMRSLSRVPPRFRTYEICKIATEHYAYNLEAVPNKIKKEHPDIYETAIAESPYDIQLVPESVQLQNPWLCKMAVAGNPRALKYVKNSVQQKFPEICRLAVAQLVTDFGSMAAVVFPEKLQSAKEELYSYIPRDILKECWDYINDTKGVITVKKSDYCR